VNTEPPGLARRGALFPIRGMRLNVRGIRARQEGRRERGTRRALTGVLLWVLLVLVAAIPAVLTAEIVLRLVYREEEVGPGYWGRGAFEHDELTGFRHAAGYRGHASRRSVFVTPVEIGRHSLRQSNFESQIEQPRKLLILGDSFAFGLGVREEAGFASVIQSPLNSTGVGVINGAQAGYGVEQEVMFGTRLAETIGPDAIVLFLFPGNDVRADHQKRYRHVEVRYGYRLPKQRRLPIRAVDFLRTHSYLWMFVSDRVVKVQGTGTRRIEDFNRLAEDDPEAAIRATVDALAELAGYCEKSNIEFGVAILPLREGTTPFDGTLRRALAREGLPVLDLAGIGLAPDDYFQGDSHWNERGHESVARAVVPFALGLLEEG